MNKHDIRADLYLVRDHVIELMRKNNIKCESLASVPLGDCYWIWGAQWEGDLPEGFEKVDLTTQKETPYYRLGYFTNGLDGACKCLPGELNGVEK